MRQKIGKRCPVGTGMISRVQVHYWLSNTEGMVGNSCGKAIITAAVTSTVLGDQLTPF